VPCLLKWCWWTLWFVRAPARFCWAVPATTWPTTHSFSTISPLLTTSDFPHLLQHAEEPPRYCLLWTFRLTPLLKEVKRVFYIFVLISLKALVKWNCPSFPRLVVLRSLWNLRLELNSCLPSIALSERTSSSQHSTLWEHQYPTIPTQYSKQEHGNCIIGTKVLR